MDKITIERETLERAIADYDSAAGNDGTLLSWNRARDNLLALLRAALAACQSEPVFSRVLCNEKARWKYCPGHWGNIDECPKSEPNKAN